MKPPASTKREHWETDYGPWAKKAEWSSRGLAGAARGQAPARRSVLWRFLILGTGLVAAVVSTTFLIAD